MIKFLLIGSLLLVGACAGGIEKVEDAADKIVLIGEDAVCNRLSVRAAKKQYWRTKERGKQWAQFCGYTQDSGPIAPLLDD